MKLKQSSKKVLLGAILLGSLSTNSFAVLGVGDQTFSFDTTAVFKKGIDSMMQNAQDSLKQWAASTAKNGVNSAASSMRSCVSNMNLSSLMSELGGGEIDLPCGEAWSISNPLDEIANSVSSDLTSSLNNWINDSIDNITDLGNYVDLYCKKEVEFVPNLGNYFETVSDKDKKGMLETVKENLGLQCPKQADKDEKVTSTSTQSVYKNEVKSVNKQMLGKSNTSTVVTKQIMDREQQLVKDKIEFNKQDNKRLAVSNPLDPKNNTLLLNVGNSMDDLATKELILKNCEVIQDPKLRSDCENTDSTITDNDKLDYIESINEDLRIPIPMFYPKKREGTNSTDGIYKQDVWSNATPNLTMKYLSPYETFSNTLAEGENGVEVVTFDKLSKKTKTNATGTSKTYEDIYKGNVPNLKNEVRDEWVDAVTSTIATKVNDKVVAKKWDGSASMDLLMKANNLVNRQIANLGSDNGNAILEINQLKAQLYAKSILVSQLQKQLKQEIDNSLDTNSYENRQLEANVKSKSEQLIVLNKMLNTLKDMGEK